MLCFSLFFKVLEGGEHGIACIEWPPAVEAIRAFSPRRHLAFATNHWIHLGPFHPYWFLRKRISINLVCRLQARFAFLWRPSFPKACLFRLSAVASACLTGSSCSWSTRTISASASAWHTGRSDSWWTHTCCWHSGRLLSSEKLPACGRLEALRKSAALNSELWIQNCCCLRYLTARASMETGYHVRVYVLGIRNLCMWSLEISQTLIHV